MELCNQVEEEPSGQPYKIVMKKVVGYLITKRIEPEAVGRIMYQLFPQLPALVVTHWEAKEGPPLLKAAETDAVVDRVYTKARKVLGPNEIPNSVWKTIYRANPGILDLVFNMALKSGLSPT